MPANVQTSSPSGVFPKLHASAWSQKRTYALSENRYRGGESQRDVLVSDQRLEWKITLPATGDQATAVEAFYETHVGKPFYFYDPWESTEFGGATHEDTSGDSTDGRFIARFTGPIKRTSRVGRTQIELQLREVK